MILKVIMMIFICEMFK